MADEGIDRKMEDKMDFTTSKEVTVNPTFESMHLKENLLRGVYALSPPIATLGGRRWADQVAQIRLRVTIRRAVASNSPDLQGERHNSAGTVGNRQDCDIQHQHLASHRYCCTRDTR